MLWQIDEGLHVRAKKLRLLGFINIQKAIDKPHEKPTAQPEQQMSTNAVTPFL
jgi:hypothetical protein